MFQKKAKQKKKKQKRQFDATEKLEINAIQPQTEKEE